MRPDILNPLFTEVEAMKGVGPQVAKTLKRLDLTRTLDVLYHLHIRHARRPYRRAGSRAH